MSGIVVEVCSLRVTVYGPERWDFESEVIGALEDAGFPTTAEQLRRPRSGQLAISFAVTAESGPSVAIRRVATVLADAGVTEALISQR
jgi:hypothetical protein